MTASHIDKNGSETTTRLTTVDLSKTVTYLATFRAATAKFELSVIFQLDLDILKMN